MIYSIIPDLSDIEKSMTLTKEYGVNFEYNDFYMPEVYGNQEEIERRIALYEALERDRSNDTMHGAFLGLDIVASDPVIRDRSRALCEQSLEIANRLGLKGVVFHTGLIGGLRVRYYIDNWLRESVNFWRDKCKEYPNLIVYMENSFEREPDVFIRLMDQMEDVKNFRLCLDYGHAILTETPIGEWVEKLARYIGHMHINDNDLNDDLHLVPGQGKIDFDKWNSLMKACSLDVSTLLELKDYENISAALNFMNQYL